MELGALMSNQKHTFAAAIFLATGMTSLTSVASAMPIADALGIKNAAPTNVQTAGGRGWGWGFGAGFIGGAVIGGALAAPYYYRPYYPGPYYYPDRYYPAPSYGPDNGDPVAYCMQRFRSYDPSSGTYLGYDGLRHPCP
jgi:BA14K-like protein